MAGSAPLVLRVAGVLAAGAVAAAAAGCSSSAGPSSAPLTGSAATSSSAAPSSPASSSAAPPASASPSPPPSATATLPSSPAPTAPGAPAGCATRDLQAKPGVSEGAAGSVYQVIDFTNIGSAPCTLYGYPGVSLTTGTTPATQVGAAASRSTAAGPTLVTLAPSQTGNALLRITQAVNYPASECSPTATTYLQIYPPNQTTPIYLPYASTGCASKSVNLVSIGVVQAGSGSSGG
jgi:hypothetical protein